MGQKDERSGLGVLGVTFNYPSPISAEKLEAIQLQALGVVLSLRKQKGTKKLAKRLVRRLDRALSGLSEENIHLVLNELAKARATSPPLAEGQLLEAYATWTELLTACIDGQDRISEEITVRVTGKEKDVCSFLDALERAAGRAEVDHYIRIAKNTGLTVGVTPSGQMFILQQDECSRLEPESAQASLALNLLERAGVSCSAIEEVE